MATYESLSQDPQFADIKPVAQDDGPNPVVAIAYTPKFKEAMDYFRAVVQAGEVSERALQLTAIVTELNPANYTAWYYRRVLLFQLNKDLDEEIKLLDDTIEDNQKNYQVWYHRKAILEKSRNITDELEFIERIMASDSKNYHAWAHRQWVVSEFGLWQGEMEFIDRLLEQDFRNNSAWNHRFYVLKNSTDLSDQVKIEELKKTFTYLFKAPNNESAWNYARGLWGYQQITAGQNASVLDELLSLTQQVLDRQPLAVYAHQTMVDALDAKNTPEDTNKAIQHCQKLAKIDSIRAKYWNYKTDVLSQKAK